MAGRTPGATATMAAVARRAGVSVTTVSHVMNRTRPVAPATAAAVLHAASELGYIPEGIVRSLRSAGLKTVGLAMSAISNLYFGTVVHSVEDALSAAGFAPLLADTYDDPVRELHAVTQLLAKQVDGLILAPVGDPERILAYAGKHDVPVVIIDRPVDAEVDQVAAESVQPTAQLVDHLAGLGHRRIALIGGRRGITTSAEREHGYRLGLRRHHLPADESLVVNGDSTATGAAAALTRLLDLDEPPTAVVVANNQMTIGTLRAAKERGVRIPDDLALVSFDDFEWADLFHPGLTAIAQPTHTMGVQAAELVLSRIHHPDLPARRIQLRTSFVHRESCGCRLEPAPGAVHRGS